MEKNNKLRDELFAALDVAPKTSIEMQAWAAVNTNGDEWISPVIQALATINESEGPSGIADALAQALEKGYPADWIVLLTRAINSKVMGQIVLPYAIAALHKDLSLILVARGASREFCDGRSLALLAQWLREANDTVAGFEYPTAELARQVFKEAQARRMKDMADEVEKLSLIERTFLGFASESMDKDDLEGFEDAVKSFSPDHILTTFGLVYYGILEKKNSGTLKRAGEYMNRLAQIYPGEMKRYLAGIVQVLKVPGDKDTEALRMMRWFIDNGVVDEAFVGDGLGAFELKDCFSQAYDKYAETHDDPELLLEEE